MTRASSERIAVWASSSSDGGIAVRSLAEAEIEGVSCDDLDALTARIDEGVGAVVVSEALLDSSCQFPHTLQ